MNLGIVVLKSIDNLVIHYIQELCWLSVPRPDQLKQPQIITLRFADLNQNYNFWGGQAVYMCACVCVFVCV